jgi:aminoglycoside phosphotransferase (APT) family kinase protein
MGRPVTERATEALDYSYMRTALQAVVQDRCGTAVAVHGMTIEPDGRSLIRYRVETYEAGMSQQPPWRVIGKVYAASAAGQRSFDAMRQLWDGGFAQQAPMQVRIPEPYTYLADLRLLLMEAVPGRSLKTLLKKKLASPEHMRLLAAAMAKLHRFPLRLGAPFTIEDHLAIRCSALPEVLAVACPELAPAIRWIVHTATDFQQRDGHAVCTLAHGDLHLGQVHLHSNTLWLLDLDPLHYGDPAYDVAMVFVALKQLEEKTQQSDYIRMLRDAFVSVYFALMDWHIARRVPLHEALIHLKRACKRFRWQDESGWPDTIRRQIWQSVNCLEAMQHSKAPQSLPEVVELYERCPASV